MTHLHVLNELSSTIEHQEQGVPSVQAVPKNLIPRLYEIAFTRQLEVFNQLPLAERVIEIQNTALTLDLKMRFLQPAIERKLKEAKTDDAIFALFQEIKSLCSEETVYNPDLFRFYMKPIIQKVPRYQYTEVTLQDFLAKTKAFPEDPALSEMLGLWYLVKIENQEELSFIFREKTFVTMIKVMYRMEATEVKALAESLKENRTLTSLDIWYNKIGDEGARALAESLKENRTLTSLNLSSRNIGDEGARALAESLKVNGRLTSLVLYNNQIGDAGARALADALKENRTLTSLDLSRNTIGDEGARAFAESLKENRTLTSLNLSSRNIRDEGARALAESLKVNGRLTSLDLYNNQIGDAGARALADALKENRTLTSLDLSRNNIGDEGARALADALKENRVLTGLDIMGNYIGVAVKQLWQEMRALHPTRNFQL